MSLMKVKATVDKHGVLTAKLPVAEAETTVDVLVDWPPKDAQTEARFLQLLSESFGSLPDLESSPQGELPAPKTW